jgi:hypothetical protein
MRVNSKKILILFILLTAFTFRVKAPFRKSFIITVSECVNPYKKLISAIGLVETKNDTLAYNEMEQATGFFQIRPIRLEEYNRRTGSNYSMDDMFDYAISEKIFLYFAEMIGPYDIEKIAKRWNGSGSLTISYWNRIKKYL